MTWPPHPPRPRANRRRPTRTTTQRGLGAPHQALRAQLLAQLTDGTPCPERPDGPGTPACGQPMIHPDRCALPPDGRDGHCRYCRLDLCHPIARALGGDGAGSYLGHARCNRRAGARIRASIHRTPATPPTW